MNGNNPQRNRRIVLIISGAVDAVIGAVILLIGFGFFPIDLADDGIPPVVLLVIGGFMLIMGAWMAIHNYSRLDE